MPRLLRYTMLALLAAPLATLAQDQDRLRDRDRLAEQDLTPDQDRTRLQLRDQLRDDGALAEADLAALDAELGAYAKSGGDPKEIRDTAREAVRAGCKGTCLAEAVRAMNAAMSRGETSAKARERVVAAVREQARAAAPATDAERGEKLRKRIAGGLEERDRGRDRDRDRTRTRDATGKAPGR